MREGSAAHGISFAATGGRVGWLHMSLASDPSRCILPYPPGVGDRAVWVVGESAPCMPSSISPRVANCVFSFSPACCTRFLLTVAEDRRCRVDVRSPSRGPRACEDGHVFAVRGTRACERTPCAGSRCARLLASLTVGSRARLSHVSAFFSRVCSLPCAGWFSCLMEPSLLLPSLPPLRSHSTTRSRPASTLLHALVDGSSRLLRVCTSVVC